MSTTVGTDLERALEAGVERLLSVQKSDGYWVAELESNVTMTAQHIFWHEFLRIADEDTVRRCANELLARRRDDGTWAIYWGGEPDLAATVEAYTALRMAGLAADDPRLAGARSYIEEEGGIGASRVFTRMWLALFGLWPWEEIQAIPPELVLLAPELPLSVYSFGCWARQTLVALSIVMHYRPVRRLPEERLAREIDLGPVERPQTAWNLLDSAIRRYNGQPVQPGRERALAYAERWLIDRQEVDGSWGGIQPPWVWSLIAFACRGHGPESPYLRRGIEGWKRFMVDDGDRLRPEACQSPVWDTCLALVALRAAGVPADEPALHKAGVAPPRGGPGSRRLGGAAPRRGARGLGVRARQRPLPGHRRRSGGRDRPQRARDRPTRRHACLRLDRGDAVAKRRLGRVRQGQRRVLAVRDPVRRLRRHHRSAERRGLRPRRRAPREGAGL